MAVVEGSLVGLFNASSGFPLVSEDFSQSIVRIDSVSSDQPYSPPPTSEVSAANTFRIEEVPVERVVATVSGPNHLDRKMIWEIQQGRNTFEDVDLVNGGDFPLRAFDSMFREVNGSAIGLLRWVAEARIVVVSPNISTSVVEAAVRELTALTGGGWAASVEARAPTPDERGAIEAGCDFSGPMPRGKIFVGQGLNDEAYTCTVDGVPGTSPTRNREIGWARVRVQNTPQSIRHGLGHAAGAVHPCTGGPDPPSVLGGSCGHYANEPAESWTDFDRQVFLLAYSRPAGTSSPDDTTSVETMTGTVTQSESAAASELVPAPPSGHASGPRSTGSPPE